MKSHKAFYILIITILLLHHFKELIKNRIIEDISGDNYKLEALLLHSKFIDSVCKEVIDKEYDKLEMNPLKIFRVYSIGMLLSMGMPIIIPFVRLL